jgi:FlaA1/EpsC-like NDP-sugar epimerase
MNFFRHRKKTLNGTLNYKTLVFFVVDAMLISLSFLVAFFISNHFSFELDEMKEVFRHIPFAILIYWLTFQFFRMYSSLWRFASVEEVSRAIVASVIATIIIYGINLLLFQGSYFIMYLLSFFFITSSTVGLRMSYRVYRSYSKYAKRENKDKRAIIIGAGDAGHLVLDELLHNSELEGSVFGFLDDNPAKIGKTIHGIPILQTTNNIESFICEYNINIVYIAIPQASQERIKELLNEISKTKALIKIFPPFYEVLEEGIESSMRLRDVEIEDLLGRDVVKLEEDGIKEYIEGKTIVVTGGGGSIGSELARQLKRFNPNRIIIIDVYENNAYELQMEFERRYRLKEVTYMPEIIVLIASVRDYERMDQIFEKYKPDVVFHAAAHKHVPLMEVSPLEAIKNNTVGTYNVATLSDKHCIDKFVLISTDKAVNATNIMGASKRAAEKIIMTINKTSSTDFAAVRFGNVLGSNGSVIPLFKSQIQTGGPLTVTHPKIIRYFMTISEACQLVIQAGAYAEGGELFILDMGEPVKILDLAVKLIRLSGLEPYKDIGIVFTGLRPGEKMYEELLLDVQRSEKTPNDKIYIEKTSEIQQDSELPILDLVKAIQENKIEESEIRNIMKEYITSYKER